MRNLVVFVLLSVLLASCSNELNLLDEQKTIPVVFGFLSPSDSAAHYLRIEKAFADPNVAPGQIAQNPDSLYFEGITVELVKPETNERFLLERVDGNLEGFPRKDGPFAQAPNYLYKIDKNKLNLKADELIRLEVKRGDNSLLTAASCKIVGSYNLRVNNPANPTRFIPNASVNFGWDSNEKQAVIYDLRLKVYYEESKLNEPGEYETKSFEISVLRNLERAAPNGVPAATTLTKMPGIDFYKAVAANIPVTNQVRILKKFDIIMDAGDQYIKNFLSVANANIGITGSEVIPVYSNIENGRGLLASRSQLKISGYQFEKTTIDSLKTNSLTKNLNFQ